MNCIIRPWAQRIAATLVALGLGLGATIAHAALAERDWKIAGDKLLTFDSSTNLEWLDVTYSLSRSVNFVTGQLGSGSLYEGFRYASWAELLTMFNSGGVTSSVNFSNVAPTYTLMGMVGGISDEPTYPFRSSNGFTSDVVSGVPTDRWLATLLINSDIPSAGPSAYAGPGYDTTFSHPTVGHWLVRAAPIPEPREYALLMAVLALAGAVVRRRRAG